MIVRALVFAVALSLVLTGPATMARAAAPPSAPAPGGVERELFDATNASRAAAGLGALAQDSRAADVARAWSREMSWSNQLSHNPHLAAQTSASITPSWTRIGENVGVGYSASSLHGAFMASAGHRANIMGNFNRVGVGAVVEESGRMWVTLVFLLGPSLANLPMGNLDGVSSGLGQAVVTGWAIDWDAPTTPVGVHFYVDGHWAGVTTANQGRADVAAAYGGAGANHGFSVALPLARGPHTVCVFGLDWTGDNPSLGCRGVVIGGPSFGSIDGARSVPGGFAVSGWAIDPDTTGAVTVHAYVNGRWGGVTGASRTRTDVGAAYPAYGSAHGYDVLVPAGHGWIELCSYGIDAVGGDTNPALGCLHRYRNAMPFGNLDLVTAAPNRIDVQGWLIDPDTTAPSAVHVYVDGRWGGAVQASTPRADVGAAYAEYGSAHGFKVSIPAGAGNHQVCAYGIDAVSAVGNPLLGCMSVAVPR